MPPVSSGSSRTDSDSRSRAAGAVAWASPMRREGTSGGPWSFREPEVRPGRDREEHPQFRELNGRAEAVAGEPTQARREEGRDRDGDRRREAKGRHPRGTENEESDSEGEQRGEPCPLPAGAARKRRALTVPPRRPEHPRPQGRGGPARPRGGHECPPAQTPREARPPRPPDQ